MKINQLAERRWFLKQSLIAILAATVLPACGSAATARVSVPLPGCGNFDRDFARLLLEICRYTYSATFPGDAGEQKELAEALDWIKKSGNPDIYHLDDGKGKDSTSVACVICYPDKNIVAYMGTKTEFNNRHNGKQSLEDWAKNLEFMPVPFTMSKKQLGIADSDEMLELARDGLVHEGFLKELRGIQAQVVKVLNEHGGKQRDLFITGHSQGGAEAALATLAFSAAGFNVGAVYTFAAPRSSNQAVAAAMPKRIAIHRIEFGNDIVPHVPTTHLGHQTVQETIADLAKLGLQAKHLASLDARHNLVGIGLLCYGSNLDKNLRVNISVEAEAKLFDQRFKALLEHPKDWAEHHHLAGSKADIAAGIKGNYSALVSDFVCRQG